LTVFPLTADCSSASIRRCTRKASRPLIAGSRLEVEHAVRLHDGLQMRGERSPLFSRRGLLRY